MRIPDKKIAATLFSGQHIAFQTSLDSGEPFKFDRERCAQNLREIGMFERNIPFFVDFASKIAWETSRNPARIDTLSTPPGEQLMYQARLRLTTAFTLSREEIELHNGGSLKAMKAAKKAASVTEPEPVA